MVFDNFQRTPTGFIWLIKTIFKKKNCSQFIIIMLKYRNTSRSRDKYFSNNVVISKKQANIKPVLIEKVTKIENLIQQLYCSPGMLLMISESPENR
jgi:hypothetical protein